MKKALYLLAFAAIPVFAHAQEKAKVDDATKQKLINNCIDQAKAAATTDEAKAAIKDFCTCSTENMLKELTPEEIENMDKQGGDQAKQQELLQKVMPLIQPCLEEFQKKMGAGQ